MKRLLVIAILILVFMFAFSMCRVGHDHPSEPLVNEPTSTTTWMSCVPRIATMTSTVLTVPSKSQVTTTKAIEHATTTTVEVVKPRFELSESERRVVECVVMGEAGGEPYDGQVLVAQCMLNACLKDGLQPSEVRVEYSYSGWNSSPSDSVKEAVRAVFDNGYTLTDEPILYFYAPKRCKSGWHETQHFVIELGGHRFFSEKQ